MKSTSSIEKVRKSLRDAVAASGTSYAAISKLSGVDESQVSRICRGQFKRLSENVVQICIALGVPMKSPVALSGTGAEQRLQAEILRVWDGTEEGALRLVRFLRSLSNLQKT